jgi:carbonic anhydrase
MSLAEEIRTGARARSGALAVPAASARPRRAAALLTCMDARIDPLAMLGVAPGDVHVIRNAGGLVTDDAIRSLSASQRLLGTDEVIVVMHEGCGLLGASDEEFSALLARDGAHPQWRVGAFADLDDELRAGLARLRAARELSAREGIHGFVFDPHSGAMREVS